MLCVGRCSQFALHLIAYRNLQLLPEIFISSTTDPISRHAKGVKWARSRKSEYSQALK